MDPNYFVKWSNGQILIQLWSSIVPDQNKSSYIMIFFWTLNLLITWLSVLHMDFFGHLPGSCRHISDLVTVAVEGTPNSEFLDLMNAIHHHVWLCVVCIFSSFAFHPVLSWGKEKVKWLSWDRSFRVLSIWKHVTTYSLL